MQHSRTLSMKVFALLLIGGFTATTVVAQGQAKPGEASPAKVAPGTPPLMLTPTGPPPGAEGTLTEQVIIAEPEVIELGEFSTTETKEAVVTLRNSSAEPVTIRSAKASCGCTTADFQRNTVLGPGETTEVKVRMRGGPTARKLNKTVTFTIDGYPQLRVPVQGESISYVKMTPDKLGIDQNPEGVIVLESIDEKPFKITRSLPDVLKSIPADAATRHEVVVDWDKWWNNAENAKLKSLLAPSLITRILSLLPTIGLNTLRYNLASASSESIQLGALVGAFCCARHILTQRAAKEQKNSTS